MRTLDIYQYEGDHVCLLWSQFLFLLLLFVLHHLAFAVVGHGEDVVGKKVVVGNVAPVD